MRLFAIHLDRVKRLIPLLGAMLLAGCPAPGARDSAADPGLVAPGSAAQPENTAAPAPVPAPAPRAPVTHENHLSPATRSLVSQAQSLAARGDADAASATLDRALRIEPNNPLLWIEMGRLRLLESDAHQAEGCARKALALASGDHASQAQAGRVLADALRAQKRNQEAMDVERQPYMR